jgi:hypothetical protein
MSLTLERVSAAPDEPVAPDEPIAPIDPSLAVPEPAPSADNVKFRPGEKIVLKASLPTLPEDTVVTGSRWEVYFADPNKGALKAPIYTFEENHGGLANEGTSEGGGDNYEIPKELPEGEYVWRTQFDFEQAGEKGSTQWSRYGAFSIGEILSGKTSSGGGCDVGLGFFAVGVAALAYLHRKGRGTK